ncbi:hypothetical protein [uncultured Roseobacter sp.]|uniref:hypothetical protein n=1 Tax=uncultured Roseobacter sp. TaxID=114847 RepID=UPI00261B6ADF|nr:hypothetical protein [uncultured Roseobacter sp.]
MESALNVLKSTRPQAAILDINLGSGGTSEPIAEELSLLGVPFAFLTAYNDDNPVVRKFPQARYASKPMSLYQLRQLLSDLTRKDAQH